VNTVAIVVVMMIIGAFAALVLEAVIRGPSDEEK
jgi:type II secretory pathway pseudopilin PulG